MFPCLITNDTYMRLLEYRDAPAVFETLDSSRKNLEQWLPFISSTRSSNDTLAFIKSALAQYAENNGMHLGIWVDQHLAGVIGLSYIDWPNRRTSIGYWLGTPYQGKGLMTHACRTLVDFLFSQYQLNRIEIQVALENQKSRAIPERLGFTHEGLVRQVEKIGDKYRDHVVYGLLSSERRLLP